MWFEKLVGFKEINPAQVRNNIKIIDDKLISKVNGKEFIFGKLEIPSLEELRNRIEIDNYHSEIKISELVDDIQKVHTDIANNNSLIQVASQFNLLEMINPNRTPEEGIGIYEFDKTQGPACAIACGAGTIYRNYFVKINGQIGQTSGNQINCLEDIGKELENDKYHHWEMKNGYAIANRRGLEKISKFITNLSEQEYEYLKGKLRVGIQKNTEVTISTNKNLITQVYCSALPVAYSGIEQKLWEEFAKLILEATYEATMFAAIKNFQQTKNNKVFLTLIGGGAFGNDKKLIFTAIKKSLIKFSKTPLNVKIVSYGKSNYEIQKLIYSIKNEIN